MSGPLEILDEVTGLPVRGRAAFALAIADLVVDQLAADPQGLALAKDALSLSWKWVAGDPVNADDIGEYVDSPTDKDLGVRELDYTDNVMIATLIAVTLAIGYAARRAYETQGATSMPSPIWEIDDHSFNDILEKAKLTPRYDDPAIRSVASFLRHRYAKQAQASLGDPITRAEVLRGAAIRSR